MSANVLASPEQTELSIQDKEQLFKGLRFFTEGVLYPFGETRPEDVAYSYARLTEALGYPEGQTVSVEMPRQVARPQDSTRYEPHNPARHHPSEDHVRGLTGLISCAPKLNASEKTKTIELVAFVASQDWYEAEDDFCEPEHIADRALTQRKARREAMDQVNQMRVQTEFRIRSQQPNQASLLSDLDQIKANLEEDWSSKTGKVAAAAGALIAGAGLLILARRRNK